VNSSIDPTTNIGKLRLRVADTGDLAIFPDSVYQAVLSETSNNLPQAAIIMAQYILGTLTTKTHRKLAQLEVWGQEAYKNYKDFLLLTVTNPHFMNLAPIPYGSGSEEQVHPLIQFQEDWNKSYHITQSQQLAFNASNSPNDGSLYGVLGNGSTQGWQLT
jgi:hypothetical protein